MGNCFGHIRSQWLAGFTLAEYSKGKLFVLVIPDNFADLYNLPPEVLNKIREVLCSELEVSIEGPSNISLYLYDNKTFIVESFLDQETGMKIILPETYDLITDLSTNQTYQGEQQQHRFYRRSSGRLNKNAFSITLKPHSFRVFRYE